jgi:hypothetical protein
MPPRLAQLVDNVPLQRTALLGAVALVPEALRDERVPTGTCSIAEVLEHLFVSQHEARHAEQIGRRLGRAPAACLH